MTMAYEADLVNQAFAADADLSDYQYYPVEMNSGEEIILASDAGDFMLRAIKVRKGVMLIERTDT